jgi:O-antigen/teichoic acid export membrane protein
MKIFDFVLARLPAPIRERAKSGTLGHRLAKSTFWSLAGSVIGRLVGIPTGVLLARLLGRHDYGELGMIYSSIELFGIFGGFGLGITATKHVAEFKRRDPERAGRILALSNVTAYITGGIFSFALYLFAERLANGPLAAPQLLIPLRISAFALFFTCVDGAQTGALAGFEAFNHLARLQLIKGILNFPFLIGGFFWSGLRGILWGVVLSRFIGLVLNRIYLNREARKAGVPLTLDGYAREFPILWRFSVPALFGGAMVAPVNWFCSTLLVHQPNGYREMGAYNAANQWFTMLLFIPTALATGIVPILSDALGENDLKRSAKVLNIMLKINGVLIIPAVLIMSLLAPYVMLIYGRDYRDAWPTLVVLLITSGIYALLTPIGEVIAASGRMWVGFGANLAWAAVLIVATYYLVHFGSFGFASARLIAYFCHAVWTFAIAYGVVLRTPVSVQEMVDIRVARAVAESDPADPSIES